MTDSNMIITGSQSTGGTKTLLGQRKTTTTTAHLLSVLPWMVWRLEKTDRSDKFSGHDWMLRMSEYKR